MEKIKITGEGINYAVTIPDGYCIDIEGSSFTEIKLKRVVFPSTWKEYCDIADINHSFDSYDIYNTVTEALLKLLLLRDCYNGDWVPDWSKQNSQHKFMIAFIDEEPGIYHTFSSRRVLVFKSKDIAELFLKNFRDLILEAKLLL